MLLVLPVVGVVIEEESTMPFLCIIVFIVTIASTIVCFAYSLKQTVGVNNLDGSDLKCKRLQG